MFAKIDNPNNPHNFHNQQQIKPYTILKNRIKHLGPIALVYFIVSTVVTGFTYCFTLTTNNDTTIITNYITIPLFYFTASMVLICHTLAMWTHPGEGVESQSLKPTTPSSLFCNKCNGPRPERAHHCKVCKMCVLKMDHHCIWVANCVGLKNQKYFYQFLFYSVVGDCIAFLCLLYKIVFSNSLILPNMDSKKKYSSVLEVIYDFRMPLLNLVSMVFAFAMTMAIGLLFGTQTKCIVYNTTTIEELIYSSDGDSDRNGNSMNISNRNSNNNNCKKINPWRSKNKMKNLTSVLGEKYIDWILPTYYIDRSYNHVNTEKSDLSYLSLADAGEESVYV